MVISTDAQNICKSSNHLFMMKTLSKFEMALLRWHSVQFSHSVMSNSATPWTAARQASVSFTISQGLLKLMSIESVMPSSHFILCYPLLLLPSVFPSIRVFPVSQLFVLGGWSIGASALVLTVNIQGWFPLRLTGLISLLSKGLPSFLRHHSWKALILQCSAFFMAQLSHPYMTTGKTIAFTIWTSWQSDISAF